MCQEDKRWTEEQFRISKNISVTDKMPYMPKIYSIKFFHEFEYETDQYLPYLEVFENARENDVIFIELNSPGGSVFTYNIIADAVDRCKCRNIIAKIFYAASAGALLALKCPYIWPMECAQMMLHSMQIANYFNDAENVQRDVNFNVEMQNTIFKPLLSKILSKEEIKDLTNGKEFYFNKKEIENRISKYANKTIQIVKVNKSSEDEEIKTEKKKK